MSIEPDISAPKYEHLLVSDNETTVQAYEDFRGSEGPILDVRSPAEFEAGRIPGARSVALFSDEERAEVGIAYKKKGRQAAMDIGYGIAEPRQEELIQKAKRLADDDRVRIYCARGGLRSKSVAGLLTSAGIKVTRLEGGYKSYRQWVRETVSRPRRIQILGGLTGTGKTDILIALGELEEQVLDLEGLANHRGSAFGGLGLPSQPTTQQYENYVAKELIKQDPEETVWIESESGRVGTCWVPEELYKQMKLAPTVEIKRPFEERLDILTEIYGSTDSNGLIDATKRIQKNLGGDRVKKAVEFIENDQLREACRVILDYYDRTYRESLKRRPVSVTRVEVGGLSDRDAAKKLKSISLTQFSNATV